MDVPTMTTPRERIEALDVVRGFALIGIALMNLDFFNRSVLKVGTGMAPGLAGVDLAAAFFTQYFVTGKFWTIFSLLFGMGFAVMLARAGAAGRSFLAPYLRRIAALAVFGALHHIFIWGGDILFSYAVGAVFLLLVLYGGWKLFAAAIAASIVASLIPGVGQVTGPLAGTLGLAALAALYLRARQRWLGLPVVALALLVPGALMLAAGAVLWAAGVGPQAIRLPLLAGGAVLLAAGWLARIDVPGASRSWRLGVAIWVLAFGAMGVSGAVTYFAPPQKAATTTASAEDTKAVAREAERTKRLQQRADRIAADESTMRSGTYAEAVALRAGHFMARPQKEVGFALILVAVFLIGTWFVRSGVVADTAAHLPLFRRLALGGIPLGVGLGLLGSPIAMYSMPGVNDAAWQVAGSLLMLGNLPASIGYASAVIVLLHGRARAALHALAPFGRMALTNYVMQSLVCAAFFYGHGLGQWSMGRAAQLGFALGLCVLQVVLSHVWLSRFRYGPLEWLWRAVTYLKLPPMRVNQPAPPGFGRLW